MYTTLLFIVITGAILYGLFRTTEKLLAIRQGHEKKAKSRSYIFRYPKGSINVKRLRNFIASEAFSFLVTHVHLLHEMGRGTGRSISRTGLRPQIRA